MKNAPVDKILILHLLDTVIVFTKQWRSLEIPRLRSINRHRRIFIFSRGFALHVRRETERGLKKDGIFQINIK